VFTPEGLEPELRHLVRDWGDTFDWLEVGDGDRTKVGDVELAFSRTDHPPPTVAVEVTGDGKRLVYTADTGADWSVGAFASGADFVLSEATYQHATKPAPIHLSAREAGEAAREAGARHLMLTHLWPRLDPVLSVAEGAEAFGDEVMLAAPHLHVTI
jgi:ribonuclease BN (tRNA processing enzyme)